MELNRRVSSAGYRLPERSTGTRTTTGGAPAERTTGQGSGQNPDRSDGFKRDEVWKEMVWKERRGVLEWEKNWGFLRNYDQMGQLKPEEPLPTYVSLFSDRFPNTSNQIFGSRMSTPLGRELVRLDRLLLFQTNHHKRKQDPEMLP
ncbi:uncharacterized protein C2orf50 homolog [Amphiprion ocellaris]|uniref:Uncharacterized protein n=1 Tax=Amphiprion ocellaris TaxID=80972 RepID=A0A3Q1BE52_AMPOC|nr:uncharacterized protein C2orf50 homolog [Amphiprion ocellaris]